ncbi:MAG TPA: site-2 protease family protein [Anaeromyxobacteraceae bacterium]|nr:site-2 protease family protein [Anaeromyxobacteraceae bacterium]
MDGATLPRRRFPWVNVALFLTTVATTIVAGAGQAPLPQAGLSVRGVIEAGLPFSAAIVGILLAHEMGHYLMARAWRVETTLPYFIPAPFGVGTFGAVIRIRSLMPSRRAVLDIGAAGPIAGFLVAVPLFAWGLAHSEVRPVGDLLASGTNTGSAYEILRALWRSEALRWGRGDVQLMGDNLVTWLLGRLVSGTPPPGHDVFLHPVAFAAWLGLFVTTLNLIPIGQLDGGHVLYALLGQRRAEAASRLVSWGLFVAGLFLSWNWLVWWLLTRTVIGMRHPPALAEEPLSPGGVALAAASLALFFLTFIPVPISV